MDDPIVNGWITNIFGKIEPSQPTFHRDMSLLQLSIVPFLAPSLMAKPMQLGGAKLYYYMLLISEWIKATADDTFIENYAKINKKVKEAIMKKVPIEVMDTVYAQAAVQLYGELVTLARRKAWIKDVRRVKMKIVNQYKDAQFEWRVSRIMEILRGKELVEEQLQKLNKDAEKEDMGEEVIVEEELGDVTGEVNL